MNHLFFILSPDLDIFWVIKDERGKVIHQGSKENQDEFGMLNINSATGFIQQSPDEGQPATERTEVKIRLKN